MKWNKVLVLAPHTDDAELGCGGTISRLLSENVVVSVAAFSMAEESVPAGYPKDTLRREFLEATRVLGIPSRNIEIFSYPVRKFPERRQEILEDLVKLRNRISPDLVLLPSSSDIHQDHRTVHEEGLRAFKETTILGYELPWNQISSNAQALFVLRQEDLERKWEALQEYRTQLSLQRTYFSREVIFGIARMRGCQVKEMWAEAFETIRCRF